jgi:hypothetical protein
VRLVRRFEKRRKAMIEDWRTRGWRAALRRGGWTMIGAIIAFYLVRDLVLYVAVPLGVIGLIGR